MFASLTHPLSISLRPLPHSPSHHESHSEVIYNSIYLAKYVNLIFIFKIEIYHCLKEYNL
jgi:hypothetical protein